MNEARGVRREVRKSPFAPRISCFVLLGFIPTVADQVATELVSGIADDAVVPEVLFGADNCRAVEPLAVVDQGLAKLFIGFLQDFENAPLERIFAS